MTRGAHTFDDELRALYRGPLADFVVARQALATRLKDAGDAREAEVRELRKPSLSAWAVNQLFAREPREMAALLTAGERARAVRRHAAAGGNSGPLRDVIAAVREAVPRLAKLGAELLAQNDRAPGEAIVERMRISLEALALDPTHAAIAERGWLDDDLPRPSFEVMAALQVGTAPPARSASQKPSAPASGPLGARATRPARSGVAEDRADRARAEAVRKERARRERIEQLRAELLAAERAAVERSKAAEKAAGAAQALARSAAEARARAEEALRQASDAEQVAARARAALERFERE